MQTMFRFYWMYFHRLGNEHWVAFSWFFLYETVLFITTNSLSKNLFFLAIFQPGNSENVEQSKGMLLMKLFLLKVLEFSCLSHLGSMRITRCARRYPWFIYSRSWSLWSTDNLFFWLMVYLCTGSISCFTSYYGSS